MTVGVEADRMRSPLGRYGIKLREPGDIEEHDETGTSYRDV